eukprot:TRINITY_DN13339_c0_g1_i5.p1 TRINITY_DN13339_c0_g1~~TRINITY_DN13339_c0_g1_i5.p1  ORF type:complete len:187 (+),score=51.86 TRINITY_DN13339_c0_g1_i5:73-633(+)
MCIRDSYDDKVIVSADKKIKMQLMIWDTAGQEIYRSLASTYYKDADIIFFIYDITSPKTFKELHYWLQQVKESGPETCVKSILGNKCDRIDCETVNDEDAAKLAAANDAKFFLVSAKENISVSKVFEEAVVRLHPKLKVLFEQREGGEVAKKAKKSVKTVKRLTSFGIRLSNSKPKRPKDSTCSCP